MYYYYTNKSCLIFLCIHCILRTLHLTTSFFYTYTRHGLIVCLRNPYTPKAWRTTSFFLSSTAVRRRLRRPSIKSKPSEESGDQDVSASINRFKIKTRTSSAASSANSAVVAAGSNKSSVKASKDDPKYKV